MQLEWSAQRAPAEGRPRSGTKSSGDVTVDHVDIPRAAPRQMPERTPPDFGLSSSNRTPPMSTNILRQAAQQRLRHIAADWPADPLRPKIQLKTFLAALAEHPALTPTSVAAANALHQNRVSGHVSHHVFRI